MSDQDSQRHEEFEAIRSSMRSQGYRETSGTISIARANIMALITTLPIIVVCIIIYVLFSPEGEFTFEFSSLVVFFLALIASVVVHEGLHGLTWAFFCKNKFQSIRFGIMRSSLTPYCHCKEPLSFHQYLLGGVMPLLVLGFGLFGAAIITGNVLILVISLFNILSAGGDLTIVLMLFKHKKALFLDHPTDCGFIAFSKLD